MPDQPERIADAVREGFASDVLLVSGGVSEGAFDLVEDVLARFDVGLLFTKVAIKPGAPLVFGRRGDRLVFGLPGNPVSAQVTFDLFVRPALLRMQGARVVARPHLRVKLKEAVHNRSGRRAHVPARVVRRATGSSPGRSRRRARPTWSRTPRRTRWSRSTPRARAPRPASAWTRCCWATSSSATAAEPRRLATSTRAAPPAWSTSPAKAVTAREAVARGRIRVSPAALRLARAGSSRRAA